MYSREDGSGTRGAFVELLGIEQADANGDKVDIEVSRTEKAEAWDVKVTNKAGETMTWIGVPLNKAGQITLLPDGKYEAR